MTIWENKCGSDYSKLYFAIITRKRVLGFPSVLFLILKFITVIIICHESGVDRPVTASSNSHFECLPSRIFSIWSIIQQYFWLPFVVRPCYMSQPIGFVLSSFLVNWFYFKVLQNLFMLSEILYLTVILKKVILIDIKFLYFYLKVHTKEFFYHNINCISLPINTCCISFQQNNLLHYTADYIGCRIKLTCLLNIYSQKITSLILCTADRHVIRNYTKRRMFVQLLNTTLSLL